MRKGLPRRDSIIIGDVQPIFCYIIMIGFLLDLSIHREIIKDKDHKFEGDVLKDL